MFSQKLDSDFLSLLSVEEAKMQGEEKCLEKRHKLEKIIYVLKQAKPAVPVRKICREHGISERAFKVGSGGAGDSEAEAVKGVGGRESQFEAALVVDLGLGERILHKVVKK
jgi:hypothetical protein